VPADTASASTPVALTNTAASSGQEFAVAGLIGSKAIDYFETWLERLVPISLIHHRTGFAMAT
jgi:hypothetical protein